MGTAKMKASRSNVSLILFLLAAFEAAFWVSATSSLAGAAPQLHEEMNGRTANYQIGGTSTLIDGASADVEFELELPAPKNELGNDPIKPPPPTQKDHPQQNQRPIAWSRLTSSDRSTGTASAKKGGGAGTHTAASKTGGGGGKSRSGKSRGKGKGNKRPNQVRRAAQTTKHGSFAVNRTAADEAVGGTAAAATRQPSVSAPTIAPKHEKAPTEEKNESEPMSFSSILIILMVVCAALALLILAQFIWKRRRGTPTVALKSIKIEDCEPSTATVSPEAPQELPSCGFAGDTNDTQQDVVPVPATTGQEDTIRLTQAASLSLASLPLVAADEMHTDTPPPPDSASLCTSVKELRKLRKAHVPSTPPMAPPPLELPPPITGEGPPTARALLQRSKLLRQAQAAGACNVHSTPRAIALLSPAVSPGPSANAEVSA